MFNIQRRGCAEKGKKKKKIANSISMAILHNFKFDPVDYISKTLSFNSKKTTEENIFNRIIENLSKDKEKYYV